MSSSMIAGYHDLIYEDRADGQAALSIGATGPEGIRLSTTKNFQEITSGETGPDTIVHTIAQGGNCFLEFVLQELTLSDRVREFLSPARFTADIVTGDIAGWNEVGRVGFGSVDVDAEVGSIGLAGNLTATPRANTPAALAHQGAAVSTRIFFGHVMGDLFETLDTTQNAIPVRFICLPFLDGNNNLVWWDWV